VTTLRPRLQAWLAPADTAFVTSEGVTLGITYFTVGLTVAVLHVTEGTTPLVMLASVFLVNSVTPTLAYAAVAEAGGSLWTGIVSGWLASSRFGLFAAAIAPRLWRSRARRAVAAHMMFDPNVAIARREPTDERVRRVFVAASAWMVVPWWIGGSLGIVVGDRLGDPDRFGFDVVFPATLLAILWPALRDRSNRWLAGLAVVLALALVEPAPGGVPVLAAAAVSLLALRGVETGDTEGAPC